ncbi:GNAT family N-acetyltransferase [Dyadobacter psychrophilus]|uniref:Acetyltransferase (GNAT) domain-containing protein n=1 Tax=Dyadobacter psychrophilus TaxID=651661 RepID=A0A1T5GZQ3_9BACT|nr:GNAT family N-acetyltransferase [Dyadobacter psychrophilus]SKC13868.1 Acetyltransferase (GNAT) domain-containing protein [Dyadobacter psychrophilus]
MEDTLTPLFSVSVRKMQTGDLPFCRHLVAEAGWNQLDSDWLRAMELEPEGCFVATINNLPVGTTTACCFGNIAWIAMVLVDKRNRNQGVGKVLVEHAIRFLEQKGITTIRLDATSLGQGLYQKLGFQPEYEVIRFRGKLLPRMPDQKNLHKVLPNDESAKDIFNLDQQITGTNRTDFISDFIHAAERPFYCTLNADGKVDGYAGCREGNNAIQIGPVGALNAVSGEKLLNAMASHFDKIPLFIDIPAANVHAVEWAAKNGFTAQRNFIRMYRGAPLTDLQQHIWASSGPEKG